MSRTCSMSAPHRLGLTALVSALLMTAPSPAHAQENLLPAAIGGALGLAGGGYVAVGIVTFNARRDEFLFSARDALGWESAPILVGGLTGLGLGLTDPDRLKRAVIGGVVGGFVGTGIGLALGTAHWDPPEGRWAGGVIGGAAGLVLGVAVGAVIPASEKEDRPPMTIPLSVSIPLR